MKTIHKFVLSMDDEQTISADILQYLSIQIQNGRLCLWCLVGDGMPHQYTIKMFGTGHPVSGIEGMHFIGTYQSANGLFVGHVWGSL